MCGAYRVCIDDPTARGAAKFLKTIREAIEGLLAATTVVLAMCCHQDRGGMVLIGEGSLRRRSDCWVARCTNILNE